MNVLALVLALQGAPLVEPANWECATPLIAKNYRQKFKSEDLAARIADECAKPYIPRPLLSDVDRAFEPQEETIYLIKRRSFIYQIDAEISRRRRSDAIPLQR